MPGQRSDKLHLDPDQPWRLSRGGHVCWIVAGLWINCVATLRFETGSEWNALESLTVRSQSPTNVKISLSGLDRSGKQASEARGALSSSHAAIVRQFQCRRYGGILFMSLNAIVESRSSLHLFTEIRIQ